MQEGMVADIVVFDPETVTDNGTYTVGQNGNPSTGIPYVLVNGTIMVRVRWSAVSTPGSRSVTP